jgi:hypothetical protein
MGDIGLGTLQQIIGGNGLAGHKGQIKVGKNRIRSSARY